MSRLTLFMIIYLTSCSSSVTIHNPDGSGEVNVLTSGTYRKISIVSESTISTIEKTVRGPFGDSDMLFICWNKAGKIEVVNPYGKVEKLDVDVRLHTYKQDLDQDSRGLPDVAKYHSGTCFEYGFQSDDVYPSHSAVIR